MGWLFCSYDHKDSSPTCTRHWWAMVVVGRASFPGPCHHKTDEEWVAVLTLLCCPGKVQGLLSSVAAGGSQEWLCHSYPYRTSSDVDGQGEGHHYPTHAACFVALNFFLTLKEGRSFFKAGASAHWGSICLCFYYCSLREWLLLLRMKVAFAYEYKQTFRRQSDTTQFN